MNLGEKWPFKLNVKVKSIEVEDMFARFTPLGLFATAALQKLSGTLKMIVINPFYTLKTLHSEMFETDYIYSFFLGGVARSKTALFHDSKDHI